MHLAPTQRVRSRAAVRVCRGIGFSRLFKAVILMFLLNSELHKKGREDKEFCQMAQ